MTKKPPQVETKEGKQAEEVALQTLLSPFFFQTFFFFSRRKKSGTDDGTTARPADRPRLFRKKYKQSQRDCYYNTTVERGGVEVFAGKTCLYIQSKEETTVRDETTVEEDVFQIFAG